MEKELRSFLKKTETVGREICCFEELDSTNNYAKHLALTGAPDGTAVFADHQTAGRGRMDRSFQSPRGKGIYLTVLLRPSQQPEQLPQVTALAAVAVCEAVERICGIRPGIKWPNDLVLRNRKLAGILTELVFDEAGKPCILLGIGINVLQTAGDFSPDVAEIATSLLMEGVQHASKVALAAALLEALDRMYAAWKAGTVAAYLAAYRRDCVNMGRAVRLAAAGRQETAMAIGVDELFGLCVRYEDGREEVVRSGEVSVRGLYGYVE